LIRARRPRQHLLAVTHRSADYLGHSLDIESLMPGNASGRIPSASSAALRDSAKAA
jgi:hypothetical protein